MPTYKVESGTMVANVTAQSHHVAAIKAIDENSDKRLGLIIGILKYGDSKGDELFIKTEYVLECMGFKLSDSPST
jgi:hypothetical protein